jgi:hypothetical protein
MGESDEQWGARVPLLRPYRVTADVARLRSWHGNSDVGQ